MDHVLRAGTNLVVTNCFFVEFVGPTCVNEAVEQEVAICIAPSDHLDQFEGIYLDSRILSKGPVSNVSFEECTYTKHLPLVFFLLSTSAAVEVDDDNVIRGLRTKLIAPVSEELSASCTLWEADAVHFAVGGVLK